MFVAIGFPHLVYCPVLISDLPAARSVSAACAGVDILLARCSQCRPTQTPPSLSARTDLPLPHRSSSGARVRLSGFSLGLCPPCCSTFLHPALCCSFLYVRRRSLFSNPFSFVSYLPSNECECPAACITAMETREPPACWSSTIRCWASPSPSLLVDTSPVCRSSEACAQMISASSWPRSVPCEHSRKSRTPRN
jgi:hypothetical protein